MKEVERTIIVGAGHGGSQCAISLRAANYQGEIYLIDADTAELPYHKPPLSKKYLLSDDQIAVPLRPASAYKKANVTRVLDSVESINTSEQTVSLLTGKDMSYSNLVLATGAHNRSLQALNGLFNVHSVRTLQDSEALRKLVHSTTAVEILGGGFIGLEIAACLAGMGKDVTVLEAADRVLGRVVSPEVSARVEKTLKELGVKLITKRMAVDFHSNEHQLSSIKLDNGDLIDTDLLIVGIGAIANESLAETAGIDCDDGILVDHSLQTSTPSVFAIGDCARYPHWQTQKMERLESVQNAVEQAKMVALQIAETSQLEYENVPWFWSDIGPLKLQIAGIRRGNTEVVIRDEDEKFALYHLQDERVVCVETVNNAKDHMLARKLISAKTRVTAQDIQAGPDVLKALLV